MGIEYGFLINIRKSKINKFISFIEQNSTLKFSVHEYEGNIRFDAWDKSFNLIISDESKYKVGDRVITQFASEDFGITLNTVLYFHMINNDDINCATWVPRVISLLKTIMNNFNGDCILYSNGYDVPVFMRKEGNLINLISNTKWKQSSLDIKLLDIPYTDMVIDN